MSSNLLERCMEVTGRTYGDGYGHAIIYCDNAANATIQLHAAACAVVAYAYSKAGLKKELHKDSDIAAFTLAMAELPSGPNAGRIVHWYNRFGKPVKPALGRTIDAHQAPPVGWSRIESPASYGWLVEACQLVLQSALGDYPPTIRAQCAEALKTAGHPGY